MNLAVLRPSRRPPRVGDIVAMLPPDGQYLFGRVVSVDANPLGVGGAILLYVHAARSNDKAAVPPLSASALLVPPMMTNRLPWSRGYFEMIENRPLGPGERLPQHCFASHLRRVPEYLDEHGVHLPGPVPPVGFFGLHSYRTIDDEISTALGIPLAPD